MRLIFIGKSHAFSLEPLQALEEHHEVVGYVEAAPRRGAPVLRSLFPRRSALNRRARRAGRPYLALPAGEHGALERLIEATSAELLCIASLSQLLAPSVLARPTYGAINLHPSLLPKYPGPFPVLWQYLAFERTWGVTVHRVDAQEDSGAILEQEPFEVETGAPLDDVLGRATAIGARLMRKAVDDLAAGSSRPRPQSGERGPRARAIRPDEPLVDWERWPIERVWHVLRGTKPWLHALKHPDVDDRDWVVLGFSREASPELPGSVMKDDGGWYAAHPQGKIRLSVDGSLRARTRRVLRSV